MIVFRRIFASLFAQPLGAARAATKGLLAFVDVTRDALGLVDELFFIPVVVVDVGAVETLNRLGGAGAGFDGLEHAEAIRAGHLRRPERALLRRPCLVCFLLCLRRLTSARLRHLCRVHALTISFFLVLGSRAGYGRGANTCKDERRACGRPPPSSAAVGE